MNGKHRYYRYAATENPTILSVHHRYIIGMHRSTYVFWLTVCSRLHTDGVPMAFHRLSSVRSFACTDSTDGFGRFGIGSLSARCPQTTSNDLIGPQTTSSDLKRPDQGPLPALYIPLCRAIPRRCSGPESNQRHADFQSAALPAELSERKARRTLASLVVLRQAVFCGFSL